MSLTDSNNNFGMSCGDGAWWIIILFLFAFMSNGSFGGYGVNGYSAEIQRGFDQSAIINELNGLNNTVTNGFANAEVSRCNANMNTLQTMNNIAAAQAQNCFTLSSGIADLKYTVASENCADRAAITSGIQTILDKMSQQELEAKNETIADLRTQLNMATLIASQTTQTNNLERYLNPSPIPAYVVANPYAYQANYYNGCGCGCGM